MGRARPGSNVQGPKGTGMDETALPLALVKSQMNGSRS